MQIIGADAHRDSLAPRRDAARVDACDQVRCQLAVLAALEAAVYVGVGAKFLDDVDGERESVVGSFE